MFSDKERHEREHLGRKGHSPAYWHWENPHARGGVVETGTIRAEQRNQMPKRNGQNSETCKLSDKLEDNERNLGILWSSSEPKR